MGVHPSLAGLGLLPGIGAGPEPDVLQARLDWQVVSTPVSVAVPTSDALCLFLKVISAGPVASTPVSVAGPAGELQVQVCRDLQVISAGPIVSTAVGVTRPASGLQVQV